MYINDYSIIHRKTSLFSDDLQRYEKELNDLVRGANFLVLGAAGSIGQAVTKEILKREPTLVHAVDISENNLAELVRDYRSSYGYIKGEFKTFVLDAGSTLFETFFNTQKPYDYIFNLTALKHVRSEKDPFTLMRLIEVNILNTIKIFKYSKNDSIKKYFCVSTDKASSPANMMGASKLIMESFLMRASQEQKISSARFANVLYSDGSLTYSFLQRIQKRHPIVAPKDIKRYFITKEESGQLCLFSCLLGENRDIFFPKLNSSHLLTFKTIALNFLECLGYTPIECLSEEEARSMISTLENNKSWPCLWTTSDTSGEKNIEEFFMSNEIVDHDTFSNIKVIKSKFKQELNQRLDNFLMMTKQLKESKTWSRQDLINLFKATAPEFSHKDTGSFLDNKM